jgi:hypothetical protein
LDSISEDIKQED